MTVPTVETNETMELAQKAEITFLVDIMARILFNRTIETGVNVLISGIHALARENSQEIREFICTCLHIVSKDIMAMGDKSNQPKTH